MLFKRLLALSFRSQMQYPSSFVLLSLSHCLATFIDIFALWVLFDRFKMVSGWGLYEVGLIYGIVQMGFAFAESFARGFDMFHLMVKQGDFDRILLRPQSSLFQIACQEVQLMRIGRLLQGSFVLIYSAFQLSLSLLSPHALVILFSILGTTALFYGLFIIQAALSFWTIEGLEIMNVATYGGVMTGQYPMSLYTPPFRLIFTFLIPLACVAYYPIATLLKHETLPLALGLFAPICGFLFLLLSTALWHLGVRHYQSTGS
jgi:ABC-2 type transport system permease protein